MLHEREAEANRKMVEGRGGVWADTIPVHVRVRSLVLAYSTMT